MEDPQKIDYLIKTKEKTLIRCKVMEVERSEEEEEEKKKTPPITLRT